jgi:hypothetical protein
MPPAPPVVSALAKSAATVSSVVVSVPAFTIPLLLNKKLSAQSAHAFLIIMSVIPWRPTAASDA